LHAVSHASIALSIFLHATGLVSGQNVTSPDAHLGRRLGADSTLADWSETRAYFDTLDRESARVVTQKVGTTTEGRDFILSVISSEENLGQLDALREYSRRLADPRGVSDAERREAIEKGRVFVFVSCAMHATETAAPQFAMRLAHELATSEAEPWISVRKNCVLLLAPSLNPDGQDHVVEWYRKTVGTPYEASELTKLYQYYTGHDNNRDWFMLTQNETRIVTELLYSVWRPQVYWDVHQQGSRAERMFIPPFRDPLNPNLDAGIISAINTIGTRALFDMTREGKSGVATGGTFDMWWNGGNRNVPVRHNIVGLLTEAASVRIATPVFLPKSELRAPDGLSEYAPSNRFPDPWPGGWWRIGDIIEYEMSFARSLFTSLSRERATWLENALAAADRTIASGANVAPTAWLVPSDNEDRGATRRLVDVLLRAGVEVGQASKEFTADGRSWPAGTLVVRRDQPYGAHVDDLFQVQRYPAGEPPYDVAGWTLPFLLGVRRVEVQGAFDAPLARVVDAAAAVEKFLDARKSEDAAARKSGNAQDESSLSARDSDSWRAVFNRLREKQPVSFLRDGPHVGSFRTEALAAGDASNPLVLKSMPRVGLYSPWSGSMDEGWMRYVFDTFGVQYSTVRNEMVRASRLADFLDVLVLPSLDPDELDRGREAGTVPDQFAGGLDPEGAVAVEEFVRAGGTLITLGSSSRWAIDLLRLPLNDVTRAASAPTAKDFSCPGSVLRGIPEDTPWTVGLPDSVALFFSRSAAYRDFDEKEREAAGLPKDLKIKPQVLMRYAPTRLLLSGWIQKPETIAGHGAWLRVPHGAGRVHLFAFRPQYRGWSQAAFHLVFRAMLFEDRVGDRE
jgi:hypothetical protein